MTSGLLHHMHEALETVSENETMGNLFPVTLFRGQKELQGFIINSI